MLEERVGSLSSLLEEPRSGSNLTANIRKLRKEYGAYFTPRSVAKVTSYIAFSAFRDDLLTALRRHPTRVTADNVVRHLLDLKICDPMAGNGAFFVEAIECLSDIRDNVAKLLSKTRTEFSPIVVSALFEEGGEARERYAKYLKEESVYGVDLNEDFVCSLRRVISDEGSPELSHVKRGNSLVSPLGLDLSTFSRLFKAELSDLIRSRRAKDAGEELVIESKRSIIEKLRAISSLRQAWTLDPFVWEIEFPEVFFDMQGNPKHNPGFDLVIGNPPWEVVKPNDREFFETFCSDFFGKKRAERDRIKAGALRNANVAREYENYLERIRALSRYFKYSGHYQRQGSNGGASPNFNLYKLSFERFYQLARRHGHVGIVTPLGLTSDSGTKGLRELLFDSTTLGAIWGFSPAAKLFSGVDQPFAICVYRKGGKTQKFHFVSGLFSPDEIPEYEKNVQILIDPHFVTKTSPLTWSIPSVRHSIEKAILLKLAEFPSLGQALSDTWNVSITRELDETNDRHMFRDRDTGIPMLKGRDVFPFTIGTPRLWVEPGLYKPHSGDSRSSRIVWRDIARPNLRRRMFSAIAPPGCALGNSLNYILMDEGEMTKYYLVGTLNSLIIDYRIRQITSNSHINQYVVSQLTIPRLSPGNPGHDHVAKIAQALSSSRSHGAIWDSAECELNATVARTYRLSLDELEYILRFYGWLPRQDREEVLHHFDRQC